ncbi:MAG: hypothetical protein JXL80_12540 [Planctomycetes bacterium]|nr:hypothetical protein [Planctomycetota bacterium]
MKLLLMHLQRIEYLEDVMLALTQVGVYDPAILDAVGGRNRLLADVPIFVGLMDGRGRSSEFHRIILAPVEDAAVADRIVQALHDGGIEWVDEQIGRMAVIDVEKWIG